jgi:hypothetical protein
VQTRRAKERGGRVEFDYYDLPAVSDYVAAVEHGRRERHVSRWLNGMSVIADETQARHRGPAVRDRNARAPRRIARCRPPAPWPVASVPAAGDRVSAAYLEGSAPTLVKLPLNHQLGHAAHGLNVIARSIPGGAPPR